MKESSNNSPKISVIVPVYNSEQYLPKCIDSILSQTFTDFELILVNDGSKDGSGDICDQYAQKDNRVRVFHKENGGVSTARNKGVELSEGKWLCFIDSDDWVEKTYIEDFGLNEDYPKGTIYLQGHKDSYGGVIQSNKKRTYYKDELLNNDINEAIEEVKLFHNGFPVLKLYETDIIRSNNIVFPKGIQFNEDWVFNFDYFKHITGVHVSSGSGYIYMHRDNNSLSQVRHTFCDSLSILEITYSKLRDLLEYFDISNNYKQELYEAISVNLYKTIYSLYRPQFKLRPNKRRELLSSVLSDYSSLLFLDNKEFITRNIFKTNNIVVIDSYYSVLFKAKYKMFGLYKVYRKYKR